MKIEKKNITLGEQVYPLIIQRKKIKHTYVRVKEGEIVVSTHIFTPIHSILALIHQHEDKIVKQFMKIEKEKERPFFYLGRPLTIHEREGNRINYRWLNENEIELIFPRDKTRDEALDRFIKSEASVIIPERFEYCLKVFQGNYPIKRPELKLRKMRSRYGSCYYKKNLVVLNTRNICFREELIDFIIFHELCHFIHPNHSPAFYRCLGQFVPNHQLLRKQLNES